MVVPEIRASWTMPATSDYRAGSPSIPRTMPPPGFTT
jgi:hypothetical protein